MTLPILLAVAVLVAAFTLVVATRPARFRIERSIAIAAPPERAFAHVNDFRNWVGWSPWEKMDPAMKKTFEGEAAGAGAIYSWAGNAKVGEGRMTIERSEAPSVVGLKLEFLKPWQATNATTFSFVPAEGGTKVTWAMEGENRTFGAKALAVVMNMDKLVGRDFERGLASLKTLAERSS
ncbi:MAG TPA: SRPBCC family protein [Polyangia bacterium]|nr:SRPBCC family protein [Polyangia bacterium]